MLRTSVLERLCAPLCDAVLGEHGSAAALDALARTNLFLRPARRPPRGGTASTTCSRRSCGSSSSGASPSSSRTLHRRAYAWHRARGTTDEAIHHAVAAGAFAEAGALIAETWVHYANAGRTASVRTGSRRFPPAVLDADARLLLVRAWVAALRGREDEMRAAAARVRALGGLERRAAARTASRSLESSLVGAAARRSAGATSAAILEHGERSAELEGPGVAVAAGDHVGARAGRTTATATSTRRSAGCARRPRSPRRPTSGSSASPRSRTCR